MSFPSSHPNSTGFTLIEMLVVISIFLIMTGVILANFPAFRDKAALDLLAQEIATTIRQAQVYGIGTREAGTLRFVSYGIYFNPGNSPNVGLDNKTFYLYASRDGDTANGFSLNTPPLNCNSANPNEDCIIEKFAITGATKIEKLCNTIDCTSPLSTLDIFFQRFYPEAIFIGPGNGSSYVKIVVQSTRDATRQKEIQVWSTGQIVVKDV